MKTKALWLVLVFLMPAGVTGAQSDYRTWTSRDGNHTLEAKFDRYDAKSKIVTLTSVERQSIEVPWNQLSRPDQRLITSLRKNDEKQKLSDERSASPFKQIKESTLQNKSTKRARTTRRFGLDWTPGLENALASASGSEGTDDDRPVMWFRVLGQLDGDM